MRRQASISYGPRPFTVSVVKLLICCCCCCSCCSHINSHNQARGHRTGSSYSGVEEYPKNKTRTKPKAVRAYIKADAILAPARKIQESEIGSRPTMCQVHTGTYVALLAPEKTRLHRLPHPEKTTTYTLHVLYLSRRIRTSDESQLEKRRKEKNKLWGHCKPHFTRTTEFISSGRPLYRV